MRTGDRCKRGAAAGNSPALLLVLGLLSLCLGACGSSAKTTSSPSDTGTTVVSTVTAPTETTPAPVETRADADHDNDIHAPGDDTRNGSTLDYGHAADSSDNRAITALIKRYYAAAEAENGAAACSMLYSVFAEGVPEDYGQSPPSQPYMRGSTCPAVMTLLFKHLHPQLALEVPKLQVARVRLVEHRGLVVLHFGALPEREIYIEREGHTWKVDTLLDNAMP